jgi:hypothetical protein
MPTKVLSSSLEGRVVWPGNFDVVPLAAALDFRGSRSPT